MESSEDKRSHIGLILGLILGVVCGIFMSGIFDKNQLSDEELKMQGRIEVITGQIGCFAIDNDGEKINWKCYSKKELQTILKSVVVGGANVR